MKSTGRNPFQVFRDQWAIMSLYERFEQVVALVLSAVIGRTCKIHFPSPPTSAGDVEWAVKSDADRIEVSQDARMQAA